MKALWLAVDIGAERFAVYLASDDDPCWTDVHDLNEGLTDKTAREIYIRASLKPRARRHAIAHELGHAGLFAFGLDSASGSVSCKREESIAYGIGNTFAHLLRLPRAPRLSP